MDLNIEKECSALGGLFQQIMNDMKQSAPVWEDFLSKSTKLHNTLRATLLATTAWLDGFQKLADLATASRGATRDIGSALTRLCMRHRSIESKLKVFSFCLLDAMVVPMQERMEEWKKTLVILDKDHTKDYKKARADIKKASSDTIRLQKKVKKGKSDVQSRLDSALYEVNEKYQVLEETEKNAVRSALIEERSRFCLFISCLKPVVDEEINMLTEVTHLQEILQHLCLQTSDPTGLPAASEQVILDLKVNGGTGWTYQTPPSSPSSLGSRKSSMCSISSINSSSSGGTNMSSPSHHFRNRNSSQSLPPGMVRLSSISSQDSGFTSQEAVFMRPPSPNTLAIKSSLTDSASSGTGTDSNTTTPSPSYPSSSVSTWSNWPDLPTTTHHANHEQSDSTGNGVAERPHTISSAYEKSHNRPALTAQHFEPPEPGLLSKATPLQKQIVPVQNSHYAVPCINSSTKTASVKGKEKNYDSVDYKPPIPGPKPKGKPVAPPMVPDFGNLGQQDESGKVVQHPVYVNQDDLAKMAAEMAIGQGRHEDIPEEDEEEEVTTPTAQYHLGSDGPSAAPSSGQGSSPGTQALVHSTPSQDGSITPTDDFDIVTLSRVIDDLSASTAALQSLGLDEDRVKVNGNMDDPIDKTACELSAAIKELEASTAALGNYSDGSMASVNNRNSLQCSSGYGTMNSTPTVSEDTIASDLDETLTNIDAELYELTRDRDRYATLPRRKPAGRAQSMRAQSPPRHSITIRESGASHASIRRSSSSLSNGNKPLPPVRRNSSISGSNSSLSSNQQHVGGARVASHQKTSSSAPSSNEHTPPGQSPTSTGHRRSHSESDGATGFPDPPPTAPKPDKSKVVEQISAAGTKAESDEADLPPPPPPEELEWDIINATRNSAPPPQGAANVNNRSSVLEKAKMFNSVNVGGGGVQPPDTSQQQRHYATPNMATSVDSMPKHYYAVPDVMATPPVGMQSEQKHYSSSNNTHAVNHRDSEMHYAASDVVADGAENTRRKAVVQRSGSVVSTHSNVISALNQQLLHHRPSSGTAAKTPTSPGAYGGVDCSDNDITPTAEAPPDGEPLLTEVKSGIVLKKAYSSDRSEPRVS